jgi:hypothetical protein
MRHNGTAIAMLVAAISTPALVPAQSHTTFVPGLGAGSFWWTRQSTGCVPRLVEIQVMASGVPLMQRRWL